MRFDDLMFPILMVAFVCMVGIGGCDRVRLSLLEDSERSMRKRVNELELRVYQLELMSDRRAKGEL